jgi:hypothetical protein
VIQFEFFTDHPLAPKLASPGTSHEEHLELELSLDEKFAAYHQAHPEVLYALIELARTERASGRTRLGMKDLFEQYRKSRAETKDDGLRINNSMSSRYARLLVERCPDLRGLFELRGLRS